MESYCLGGYHLHQGASLDTGEYHFTWNPLEEDADAFLIRIFDQDKREQGWYLNKTNPENVDISEMFG